MDKSSSPDIFASPFSAELAAHIRDHLGDILGQQIALLEQEDGLEEVIFRLECGEFGPLP